MGWIRREIINPEVIKKNQEAREFIKLYDTHLQSNPLVAHRIKRQIGDFWRQNHQYLTKNCTKVR